MFTWLEKNNISLADYITTTKLPSDSDLISSTSAAFLVNQVMESESENREEDANDKDEVSITCKALTSVTIVSNFLHHRSAKSSIFEVYDKIYRYSETPALTKNN